MSCVHWVVRLGCGECGAPLAIMLCPGNARMGQGSCHGPVGPAETPVIGFVTQFGGTETALVMYRAADSHLHEMSYPHPA